MPGIGNNLYPPIVDSWMPAFIRTDAGGCRVYFSISSYNSLSEINTQAVQVSINHQKTNVTALNNTNYPSGIKLSTMYIDQDRDSDDKYYIQLMPTDLQQGQFNLNEYYKVQIRFTMSTIQAPSSSRGIDSWLSANITAFSEWSTVCLIRGISNPIVRLNNFDTESVTTFSLTTLQLVGSVDFSERDDSEQLKSYQILLYNINEDQQNLLWSSQEFFTSKYNNPNEINTQLLYEFEQNKIYKLGVKITTNNLYTGITYFDFNISGYSDKSLEASIIATPDNRSGCMKIHVTSITPFAGNLTIRRSSYKTNFKVWEDVKTVLITELSNLNYIWFDKTVESGVWYKYCVQRRNIRGYRSLAIETRNPSMVVFQDMFLVAQNKQLNIRFDPKLDSFSHTIVQGKTDTIGSKYPFIKRNNYIDYRTFPIGGTITMFMDQRNDFMSASKNDLYGEYKTYYDTYNEENNITPYNDYVYERDFREKVIDFLYKNNAKLFKSTTEGNIIVKLMDISLTPNATLGRMIYSFTATAYEIDEYNLKNCDKYNIQTIGEIENHIEVLYSIQGQQVRPKQESSYVQQQNFNAGAAYDFVTSILPRKYKKLALEDFNSTIQSLSYLRIQFTSNPYLIESYNNVPRKYTGNTTGTGALTLGHIVYINKKPIIISKQGIYELKGEDVNITSFYFDQKEQGYVDYIANIYMEQDLTKVAKVLSVKDKVGQLYGFFDLQSNLFPKIESRYTQVYSTPATEEEDVSYYQRRFVSLDGLRFTADPGTVVYVKQAQDSDLERHVIGETQILEFFDSDTNINAFYFAGIHLQPARDPQSIRFGEYYETGVVVNDLTDLDSPIQGGIYTVADQAINASYETKTQYLAKRNNKYTQLNLREVDDFEQSQESPYEVAKHNEENTPRNHDTLILEKQYLVPSEHNVRTLADAIILNASSAGIQILGIYDNDQYDSEPPRGITVGKAPIIGDKKDAAKFNKDFSKILNSNTLNITVNDLYRAIVERVILESNKYIFYDNGWYPITNTYDLIKPVTAIVDYYCHYQEGRY